MSPARREPTSAVARASSRGGRYWSDARAPRYALTLALPLLVLYEVLAVLTAGNGQGAIRNGADVLIQQAFSAVAGRWGPVAFSLVVLGGSAVLVLRDIKAKGAPRWSRLGLMLVESGALGLATGLVVGSLTQGLLSRLHLLSIGGGALDVPTQIALSLGAGLYEELLFRVALVGALMFGGHVVLGWSRPVATTVALIVSALVFSAFHYVGPMGDAFTVSSFTFRALAGLWFSGLYVTRGFGITAWAHALYDVALTLAGA